MSMRDLENPMVRDELWPDDEDEDTMNEAYWQWVDDQIDQARGK